MEMYPNKLKQQDCKKILKAIEAIKLHRFERFQPYPWQKEFYAAGKDNKQRLVMAGNRVGKTDGTIFEGAAHALGRYPDWWEGHKFNFAPVIWCCGVSGEQMRDVLQKKLFGTMTGRGEFTGGLIKPSEVVEVVRDQGTPRLGKDIRVRHRSGGTTTISFKSYTQGTDPLMGSNVDVAIVDEQPPDSAYTQILTRTTLGNRGRGGLMIIGYTPEKGLTKVLQNWMNKPSPGQWMRQVTWDDSPHLTETIKQQMREAYPENERQLREEGLPVFGAGPIFTASPSDYLVKPFTIPGHWHVVAGIDFGIRHRFASVWTARDPETGKKYIYNEYVSRNTLPPVHAAALNGFGDKIPIVYPHDGNATEKGSGKTLAEIYRENKANITMRFSNDDGSLYVNPGLIAMNNELSTGQLFIFESCIETRKEMLSYHRDDKGKVVAVNDDVMSAMRYSSRMAQRIYIPYANAFSVSASVQNRDHLLAALQPDY